MMFEYSTERNIWNQKRGSNWTVMKIAREVNPEFVRPTFLQIILWLSSQGGWRAV
jgi:hypothetical protein